MKKYKIAILGASGAVGREMLNVLIERNFPIKELHLLASERSAGKKIIVNNHEYTIEKCIEQSFDNMDIVFGAVENDVAKIYLPIAAKSGAIVIDNSSAFRMDDKVPLIIPEVNPEDAFKHQGIIANPNCATIIALVALQPLNAHAKIKRIVASTYQAVSGAGVNGVKEMYDQVSAIANNSSISTNVFSHQIAYNLIPQIGDFDINGYSSEEMKMQNEGQKILKNKALAINCTCVRVPVERSHSISIMAEFANPITVEKAKALYKNALGIKLVDMLNPPLYPMPLDSSNQDLVYVGRIRQDLSKRKNALSLWCCGDQVRKGAATNAIQIAELFIKKSPR